MLCHHVQRVGVRTVSDEQQHYQNAKVSRQAFELVVQNLIGNLRSKVEEMEPLFENILHHSSTLKQPVIHIQQAAQKW
ncbi:hypothetical protein X801_00667, partial [Opisthorchis viverrini]